MFRESANKENIMAILKNDPYNSLEEALKDLNNLDKPFEVGKIYVIRYNTNITI